MPDASKPEATDPFRRLRPHGLNTRYVLRRQRALPWAEQLGTKQWVLRATINGKRIMLGLGGFPTVSLADARELAAETQRAIRQGRDPLAEKRQAAEDRRRPAVPTFAEAAQRVIEMRRPTWSNPEHAAQWTSILVAYAHPVIGRKPVDEITTADVLAVLSPIWTAKAETARPAGCASGWKPSSTG